MPSYALIPNGVTRLDDNATIPNDSHNRDWLDYLAWLAADPLNIPRPLPPDSTFDWNGSAWAPNATRVASAALEIQLAADIAASRSLGPLVAFVKMSPAQIDTYIDANVTNLAGAIAALKLLAKAVNVLARRTLAG